MKHTLALAALLALPVLAVAQDHSGHNMDHKTHTSGHVSGHAGHAMTMEHKGDMGPSSKAFFAANIDMHKGMDIEFSGDADIDFLKGMIPHHQGAVDMAQIQLRYGKDAQIKQLSRAIIRAQEGEISWMNSLLASLPTLKNTDSPSNKEFADANIVMHDKMNIEFSGDADIDFLKGMIPHHQGAVDMAQIQLKYGKDPQVKRLTRAIIKAQNGEIRWMTNRLHQLEQLEAGWTDEAWLGAGH